MEDLEKLTPPNDSNRNEILSKLANYKMMLEKYAASNPEWCAIGKNRIEQLEVESAPKKPKESTSMVDDFFMYSDEEPEQEQEDEEEIMEEVQEEMEDD